MKKHVYKKGSRIKYNNQTFLVLVRDDNQTGFLKIVYNGDKEEYQYPTAHEFLHLSSFMNVDNRIKF